MNETWLVTPLAGWDDRLKPAPNGAEWLQDVVARPDGSWVTRGGIRPALMTNTELPAFVSVHSTAFFSQQRGGRNWMIIEGKRQNGGVDLQNNLYAWAPWEHTEGTQTERILGDRAQTRPWVRPVYITIGDWLYFSNGEQRMRRWNGTEVVPVGFSISPPPLQLRWLKVPDQTLRWLEGYEDPNAVSLRMRGVGPLDAEAVSVGANDTPERGLRGWQVQYWYTWVNDLGQESPRSPASHLQGENVVNGLKDVNDWAPQPSDGRTHVEVLIPEGPETARGVRIYRSVTRRIDEEGSTSQLFAEPGYLVASLPSCTQQVWLDNTLDNALGSLYPLDQEPTVVGTHITDMVFHRGRLFAVVGDRIRFSNIGKAEEFPSGNILQVGGHDEGPVTAMISSRDALYIFRRRAIFIVSPASDLTTVQAGVLTNEVGSVSKAVIEVPGLGVIFLAEDGPYILEGHPQAPGYHTRVRFIGRNIRKLWRRVSRGAAIDCTIQLHTGRQEVWFGVPMDGDSTPRHLLVYHYLHDQWSFSPDYPCETLITLNDHRNYMVVSGDGIIGTYTQTVDTVPLRSMESIYRSAWLDFGDQHNRTMVTHVEAEVALMGDFELSLTAAVDRRDETYEPEVRTAEDHAWEERPRWGIDTWTVDEKWTDYVLQPLVFSVQQQEALDFQWELTGSRFHLAGVGLRVDQKKPKQHHPKIEQALGEAR